MPQVTGVDDQFGTWAISPQATDNTGVGRNG
jgi:hypothetical protein